MSWFLGGSSHTTEEQPHQATPAKQEGPSKPLLPNPALAGTWKGVVGSTNSVTIQIHLEPGERVTVLVDNQAANTVGEEAEVLAASGGFIEMDMGNPTRARCSLRLASDRRNLEGTWIQNPPPRPGFRPGQRPVPSGPEKSKPSRTFNVVFTKVER